LGTSFSEIASSKRNLRRAVLALTEAWDGLNRNQLASWLALSRPTVTALVDDLKKLDWAHETQEPLFRDGPRSTAPSLGRPEGTIRLTEAAGYVGVINAGHTTMRVFLASNAGVVGEPHRTANFEVDSIGPSALGMAISILSELLRDAGLGPDMLRAITVGIPAPVNSETGEIASPSFMRSWAQTDIRRTVRELIAERLGIPRTSRQPEVFVENEANAMARGVLARGFAGDRENFLLLKISSGIGAGVVLGGRVYTGSSGGAGEFGHLPTCDSSERLEPCSRCLRHGCIETVASASAIVRRLTRESLAYPRDIQPSTIIENAQDPVRHTDCHRVIVEAGEHIGEVLASVVSFLDVERVVVAGVMAEAGDLLLDPMRNVVHKNAINFIRPKIEALDRKARAEIGVYGGAVLGLSKAKPLFLDQLEEEP
jgi:predicted NBD/HSP70 family sugar kinase